ncbi:AI-2E family transporter [Pseudonocardia alaniniphila]|uniref:AI-2E family transporter n=1 Tax=Pseudonocardia alaniniphila TaxID=75291 RepID=A0ABS9TPZ2_9PSEU|nr:AI-2E family transporter [Pseudonocardia alaniniphila]MCH6170604.1 AI-2E family transporter [Pseudonocardia alaniniphila]
MADRRRLAATAARRRLATPVPRRRRAATVAGTAAPLGVTRGSAILRPESGRGVPRGLVLAAGWSWRLLVLGVVAYLAIRVLALLWLVLVPIVVALLVTALVRPLAVLLRRHLPGPLSALLTLLVALMVLAGLGWVIDLRFTQELPSLIEEVVRTVRELGATLARLGLGEEQLAELQANLIRWLQDNRSELIAYLTTGTGFAVEIATAIVLTFFVTFFLLYDGERVWRWLLMPLRPRMSARADRAGRIAWSTLTGYVHGTAIIATIHGIVIGLVVSLLHVPLAIPLAVLVFIGSFIPIVGALVSGAVAVVVTLGTHGLLAGLIVLGVLVVEDQLEAHLLQPLIVGRYVRLHPLAIGLVLATGTVLGGLVGAIVAVPVAAIVHRTWPALLGHDEHPAAPPAPRRRSFLRANRPAAQEE